MDPKNQASGISIFIALVCIILAVTGAESLHRILSHINGWQAVSYAIVGGIFIALIAAILSGILSFFRHG